MIITRDYLVELAKYLPEFLRQDPEMKAILEVESSEHRVQVEILKDIQKQLFVDTATWGLAFFEKELGLKPNATDNYEQRRNRILIYLQQRKTVNKEFIEELFSRYVSEGSQIVVMEDNPDNTFWVIDTGGRILYPDDLHEAIETYKPAHLRYGLEIRRDLPITEEDMIRLALASLFSGVRHIGIAAPEETQFSLNTSIIPAKSGVIRIEAWPATFSEKFLFGVRIGHAFTGRRDIDVSKEDLPEVFKEEAARLAPILGFAYKAKGIRVLPLALPEAGEIPISYGSNIHETGIRQYGLAPPQEGIFIPGVEFAHVQDGRRDIAASREDLPEWYKGALDNARIAEYIGTADHLTGQKHIGLAQPEAGNIPFAASFLHGIFGASTIEADKGDLPQEFTERISRAAALLGIAVRTQGYRRVKLAEPETAEAAFGVGVLQDRSGKRVIPLASPEEAVAGQGVGFWTAQSGRRTLPVNSADLPEWFQNALTDAVAAEYISTALYTQGIRKTSLTLPEAVTGLFGVGTAYEQNGVKEIRAGESDIPQMFKNILEDAGICSYLGIEITAKGRRSIGLTPITAGKPLQLVTGQTTKLSGTATIRAAPEDLPDYFKELSDSRAAVMAGIKLLQKTKIHISLAKPEEGRAALAVTVAGMQGGKKSIVPELPEDTETKTNIGFTNAYGGRRDIYADKADLPEWHTNILEPARAAVYEGIWTGGRGEKRISLAKPEEEKARLYHGTAGAITGYVVIGADLSDLNPPAKRKARRFHAGLSHVGAMAVG